MDVPFSECRIYNLDHSLYKTIRVKLDPNHYLYDISYVTRRLFNHDDSIEFLYMAYEYIEDTVPYYQYMVGVVNETGTSLLKVPEGTYYEIIEVEADPKYLHLDMIFNIVGDKTAVAYWEGLPKHFQK